MNTAILFDTMSIQQYVFGSNKLKDNLGASYIIENIYDYLKQKSDIPNSELKRGYIGGGNALFFTTSELKAKEIVKEFTVYLLLNYPGVSLAVAIEESFNSDEKPYSEKIGKLFQKLATNKGIYLPINTIPAHGITDTCKTSSLSVELINDYNEKGKKKYELVSSFTQTKRNFKDEIKKEEASLLEVGISNYQFSDEIDKLGQKKSEDSHIAVVHIDGNGFGKHFIEKDSVEDTNQLSDKVKTAVKRAFIYSLTSYCQMEEEVKHLIDSYNYANNILPIRPIVLGGDDVTFVCHGKLGIWFAEKFMEKFNSNFIDEENSIQFSSCAGVAIVKTKYPFYRAYQLAEELCHSAKNKRKKYMDENNTEEGGNWIDFQLAYSGLGNNLEEVRKLQYNVNGFNRPYRIEKTELLNSFENLKVLTAKLSSTLPKSKIKDLREMLTKDTASLGDFIEHLKFQHNEENGFNEQIIQNKPTDDIIKLIPFFDMIELLEIYPTNLLID